MAILWPPSDSKCLDLTDNWHLAAGGSRRHKRWRLIIGSRRSAVSGSSPNENWQNYGKSSRLRKRLLWRHSPCLYYDIWAYISTYVSAVILQSTFNALMKTSEQEINRLGKRLQVRQQAMATAQLYVRRFYSKVEIRRTNPYLVIATAVYLACKMEESPQHIRLVVTEARTLWPGIRLLPICLLQIHTE